MPFRPKFALHRMTPQYWRKLAQVLVSPSDFYIALLLNFFPGLPSPVRYLRLKDGKKIKIEEFWVLFLFDEIFIQGCYDVPSMISEPVKSVIDVGANRGLFDIRAKQLWPNATIISCEPDPSNFARLQEHIAINKLENVVPLQIGLTEKCGCFDLYLSPRNIAGHSMHVKTEHSIKVQTKTLSDMLELLPNGTCDFLKIDCEGCEFELLDTLTQAVADRIGFIVYEATRSQYDVPALNAKLGGLGYRVSNFDELIVATRHAA